MENLPQNWVIDTEKEKDSPLMSKFMEWFKSKDAFYNSEKRYLGVFDDKFSDWIPDNECKLITIQEWNAFYFPEWQPEQGEVILVSNFKEGQYQERIFIIHHKGHYICEGGENNGIALTWCYAKPLPKESILQPLVDQLKAEAEKLGLKVNITVE